MDKIKESLEDTTRFIRRHWGPLLIFTLLIGFMSFIGVQIVHIEDTHSQAVELCKPAELGAWTSELIEGATIALCYDESANELTIQRAATVKAFWEE